MIVLLLLRTPLRVSRLQRKWVPGNRTYQLADRRRFAPQVCFTYHSSIFFMHWGQLHVFFVGGGVNGK